MINPLLVESLVSRASGSAGAFTFGRNQFGPWIRNRGVPTDPATPLQLFMRTGMETFTDRWATLLNPEQRASWDLYARNVYLPGRLGRSNHVGALPHYLRSALPRWQVTAPPLAIVDAAPRLFDLGPYTPITRAVSNLVDQTLIIFFDNTDPWAAEVGAGFLIRLSGLKPSTLTFYKGPYRFHSIVRGNPSPLPTTPATFPAPVPTGPDDHFFLRGRITRADGRLSQPFRLDVAPAPQVPAQPVSLQRVVPFPPQYDVGFDDQIAVEPHAPFPWGLRADLTIWNVITATTVAGKIRLRVTAIGATDLRDRVQYAPPPPDVRGITTTLPVNPFVFFP
jgi:hypothetical protein